MKHYLIWLKGGGCVEGDCADDIAEHLPELLSKTGGVNVIEDTDGKTYVRRGEVLAVAINNAEDNKNPAGF